MGNTKANSIYNPDESRHPPPTNTSEFNDRDSELEKFIRRKYVEGRFKPSAAGYAEEVSRPRASSIRANGTGTSTTGSFQRQSPNPELNDIVVPRSRTPGGGSAEETRPPIFATRSSGNGMGVTDSPGRSRPRPTHSATLEIPVLSHEESSAYSLDHPSGSGRPGSSSGSRPRSFLSTAGRGATKNMVQDNWNDLMLASSADETQTGPGGRRSPNPFARAQSANAGRSTAARPESRSQAVAPALEVRYGEQKAQGASGGAFGDLLGIGAGSGSGSTPGPNGSGHLGQPTSTPSYGVQYTQQQQQPTMQQSYSTPTSQPFTGGMVNGSMSTQFPSNGMNGNMGMGMGMNGGMSTQTPNGMQINPNMNMGMNQGMSMGTGSTSPFPLAATSPYSSFSNGNGGYFPQQPQYAQPQPQYAQPQPQQTQYVPQQQLYQQPQSQFQQQGYPQMQMPMQMQGYGQAQGQSMPMQGNQMGMMIPPGWGGAGASR
jgi:stromal membrane-associated protein